MMSVDQTVEWELAGEIEITGENVSQCHSSTTNPTWPYLGSNPGRRGKNPATNRLSYGTAVIITNNTYELIEMLYKQAVKVSMCLTNEALMKVYEWMDVQSHVFLTLALVRGEWSASCLTRFPPGKEPPGTYWRLGGVPEPVRTTWRIG
jgi:hypothetical protein